MNHRHLLLSSAVAAAVLAGCSTLPADNARLTEARNDYRIAQDDPQVRALAPVELRQAGDALARADESWTRKASPAETDHWAYIARQRVAIARESGTQKAAEGVVAQAQASRDRVRLAARTEQADAAQRNAEAAQRGAESARREAQASQQQSQDARLQAAASQREAADAQARSSELETQLRDLNAKQTPRGVVVTIGDVLFETGNAQLRAGGLQNVEKLAGFLKRFPQRQALIEGYTDSVGSESHNLALSARRADAVRGAIVGMGVGRERLRTEGYGEAHPVAANDSSSGRQLNRRVEILLSDEAGTILPR